MASWSEGTASLDVSGRDGEVLYVELVGVAWSWGSKFCLTAGDPDWSRQRVSNLRMVGDVG
jgi:hypothetical protein